jgi:hypothetical protein
VGDSSRAQDSAQHPPPARHWLGEVSFASWTTALFCGIIITRGEPILLNLQSRADRTGAPRLILLDRRFGAAAILSRSAIRLPRLAMHPQRLCTLPRNHGAWRGVRARFLLAVSPVVSSHYSLVVTGWITPALFDVHRRSGRRCTEANHLRPSSELGLTTFAQIEVTTLQLL